MSGLAGGLVRQSIAIDGGIGVRPPAALPLAASILISLA
jgi:hypothetical protein